MGESGVDELLSFYKEYILAFAKLFKLLHQLLVQDNQPWMEATREYVCKVVWHIITMPHWLNADLSAELRIETRVSSQAIATLFMQIHKDKLQTYMTMASWGYFHS